MMSLLRVSAWVNTLLASGSVNRQGLVSAAVQKLRSINRFFVEPAV